MDHVVEVLQGVVQALPRDGTCRLGEQRDRVKVRLG